MPDGTPPMPAPPAEVPGRVVLCEPPPSCASLDEGSAVTLAPGYCAGPPVFAKPWRPEASRGGVALSYDEALATVAPLVPGDVEAARVACEGMAARGRRYAYAMRDVDALAGGRVEEAIEW